MSVTNLNIPGPSPIEAIRVIYRVGVRIAGKWVWNDLELPAPVAAPENVQQLRRAGDKPKTQLPAPLPIPRESVPAKPAEPKFMTNGRDPAKFEITFGRFFKENANKPIALENIDIYDLEKYHHTMKDTENPSAKLEVGLEMIAAFLYSRETPEGKKRKESSRGSRS